MTLELPRRHFLMATGAAGLGLTAQSTLWGAEELAETPAQTSGPFYPVPEIQKQQFHDTDLTRKLGKDEVAKGEVILLKGVVKNTKGKVIPNALVELWQACSSGKYNHKRDDNLAELDEKFQFWGRSIVKEDGAFEFLTIKPGAYPGRTPHLHFHIFAPGYRRLVTQTYFEDEARANARDGIYRSLNQQGKQALTIAFANNEKQPNAKQGEFNVVLTPAPKIR